MVPQLGQIVSLCSNMHLLGRWEEAGAHEG